MNFKTVHIFLKEHTHQVFSNIKEEDIYPLVKKVDDKSYKIGIGWDEKKKVIGAECLTESGQIYSWRPFLGNISPEQKISGILNKRKDDIILCDFKMLHGIHLGSPAHPEPLGRVLITDAEIINESIHLTVENRHSKVVSLPLNELNICSNKIELSLHQDYDPLGTNEVTEFVLEKGYINMQDTEEDTNIQQLHWTTRQTIEKVHGNFYETRNSYISVSVADSISKFFGTSKVDNCFIRSLVIGGNHIVDDALAILKLQEEKLQNNSSFSI